MARKVESEDERLRRIFLIRDYVLTKIEKGEKFSTRSIAKYFTDNDFFSVSNNTVSVYLNSLAKLDPISYEKIQKVLEANKPKTINDEDVKIRINMAVDLLLQDYTMEEIANRLGVSTNTIFRDLNDRLEKMNYDSHKLEQIKNMLVKHSMRNLKNQNRTPRQGH